MGLPYIDTSVVKTRLESSLTTPDVKVFRAGERDLKTSFGKVTPAVYILKQYFNSPTPGGSSRIIRQAFDVYLELAVVAKRYADGVLEGELARQTLVDDVVDVLLGFNAGLDLAFDLSSYTDGDPADTVNYGTLVFHTVSQYQKEVTP